MAYKHGVYSIVGEPIGEAVVSSDTTLVVVGSTASLAAGSIALCTSYADYIAKCGEGTFADFSAQSVAKYAFEEAHLAEMVVISTGDGVGTTQSAITANAPKIKAVPLAVGRKPGIVVAPVEDGLSATAVAALVAGATDIEGAESYSAIVCADIGGDSVSNIIAAKAAITPARNLALFGGEVSIPEETEDNPDDYRIVTAGLAYACEQVLVDAENNGIPFEGASNRRIRCAAPVISPKMGRVDGNSVNAAGVNTLICDGGEVLIWGAYLSPYTYASPTAADEIFVVTQRMLDYCRRGFLGRWARIIDQGFTRQLRDTIMVREQAALDRLVGVGALMGSPRIEFHELDNPNSEILQGNFVWQMQISPTIPLVSATLKVSFTDSGYHVLFA